MNFNLEPQNIGTALTCLDSVSEQSVDLDFTLPDYCPDIEKILKCSLIPQIFSRNLNGGQLVIDGTSTVQVLYVDAVKKNIRCCEQTVPFSAAFNLKEPAENYVILSDTKSEYINCRALSPRKLVLHGAFSLYAKVISKSYEKIYNSTEENELETKCQKITCCELSGLCQEQFSVSEEISVANKPSVEAVLNKKVTANVTDARVIPGKIMLNGEINLKLLYLSDLETGEPQQLDYVLPFSQIIDCESVTENTVTSLSVQVLSYDVRLKSDMLSENPVISLDAKLCASIMGYDKSEKEIITDAYSTKYFTELEYVNPMLVESCNPMKETVMQKATLDLGEMHISKIVDLFNESCTATPVITEEGVTVTGKANVCILALDSENYPVYIERMIDFEQLFALTDEFNGVSNPKAVIKSLSFRLSDEATVEVRCEISISFDLLNNKIQSCVSEVFSPDDKEITPCEYALTLYYAQKGEKLWDIAKKYNTKLQLLTQENSIDTEVLENAEMLLIPSV